MASLSDEITAYRSALPIGSVLPWTMPTAPSGYKLCNGQELNRSVYSDLFSVIGTTYGVGNGTTTFNVPKSDYDTGWINRSDWTNVNLGTTATKNVDSNVLHNLKAKLSELNVKLMVSTDGTDANSFELKDASWNYNTTDYPNIGWSLYQVDEDSFTVQSGQQGIAYLNATGNIVIIDTEDWYYKITVERKDFPKGSIIRAENVSVTLENVSSDTIADLTVTNSTELSGPVTVNDDISSPQVCKAWVNFDGTTNVGGFCTIRDSYNVASVTDNGTGSYTINFTNAMSNANYTVTGSVNGPPDGFVGTNSLSTGAVALRVIGHAGSFMDSTAVCVQIFGT